jgi:hypothetical protein
VFAAAIFVGGAEGCRSRSSCRRLFSAPLGTNDRSGRARAERMLMTTFDEREQAYEAKLAHDEELKFRAIVRRNKWLGLWAAEKLGKSGAAAETYAMSLIAAEIAHNGESKIFQTIRADFDKAGVAQSDHQIRREMEELFAKALKDLATNGIEAKSPAR